MKNLYELPTNFGWLIHTRQEQTRIQKFLELYRYGLAKLLYQLAWNKQKKFTYRGNTLYYYSKQYNNTYISERAVEIPIVLEYIKKFKQAQILEIGAVLPHYVTANWTVVDKFEKKESVKNIDIIAYKPAKKYDLVVSISTLEHVGYDDDNQDPQKILKTIRHIKNHLLSSKGTFLCTVPVGYNPHLDQQLKAQKIPFDQTYALERINILNYWRETTIENALKKKYGYPYNNANAIIIGIINKKESR